MTNAHVQSEVQGIKHTLTSRWLLPQQRILHSEWLVRACTRRPPSLSLRATTSTWLLPRNTRKLCGPRRDTFTVYFRPARIDQAYDAAGNHTLSEREPSTHFFRVTATSATSDIEIPMPEARCWYTITGCLYTCRHPGRSDVWSPSKQNKQRRAPELPLEGMAEPRTTRGLFKENRARLRSRCACRHVADPQPCIRGDMGLGTAIMMTGSCLRP